MDSIDNKIVDFLMRNGRATWSELGNLTGLSAPAVAERVRRLEETGIITGYGAITNPEKLGFGISAIISVSITHPSNREPFIQKVRELACIQECYHVAGDEDYLLKVRVRDIRELEYLVSDIIKDLPGIMQTRTKIIMSVLKESIVLPIYK